jgi:hypothetical protein
MFNCQVYVFCGAAHGAILDKGVEQGTHWEVENQVWTGCYGDTRSETGVDAKRRMILVIPHV